MEADYIVVGTGSAGSVVVNRLSGDPGSQVVVLEAGPRDKDKFIHIPLTWAVKLFRSAVDWDYLTEPQKELNGRQIYWPRGKMLGGSSSMNAQMWVRGFAADYDEWGELAGDQWSFDQVAPTSTASRPGRSSYHRNGARAARPQRGSRRPRKAATASNHRIPVRRKAFARRW
jgi:choline dehydrogenase